MNNIDEDMAECEKGPGWDDETAFATLLELFMGPLAECEKHGWVKVVEEGHNSGFAGEGFWWVNLSCGCQIVETGEYYDA